MQYCIDYSNTQLCRTIQLQEFLDDETTSVHVSRVIDYILDGIPPPEEFTETNDFKEIFFLVDNYVSKLYGMTYLTKKVKNNPGSTIWDYITNSDIAYVCCLLINSIECWDQEWKRENELDEEELEMWNRKRSSLTTEEKEKYKKLAPKFTSSKGRKRDVYEHGWNRQGLEFFKKVLKELKRLTHNNDYVDRRNVAWEKYLEDMQGTAGSQYSKKTASTKNLEEEEEDIEEYDDDDLYGLPGDEGFVPDYRKVGKSSALDEEELDDDEEIYGKEGGPITNQQLNNRISRDSGKSRKRPLEESDDSSSEEEEPTPKKRKETNRRVSRSP